MGKSAIAGIAALWFMETFEPAVVITTAPTERQVKQILWREIRYWHNKAKYTLDGMPRILSWDISPKHFALGITTSPESQQQLQGLHGPHIMVIIDEANGYFDELYEPIESILCGGNLAILFQIGNPLNPQGKFFESFSAPDVWTHTISCLKHPNVVQRKSIIPGAVTYEWVERQKKLWGTDSAFWKGHVLGEFPKMGADTVVNLAWVERAEQNKVSKAKVDNEQRYMGYDPAEYGPDDHVWFVGTERKRLYTLAKRGIEPAEGIGITKNLAERFNVSKQNISVDGIGAGATICSVLKTDGYDINRFVVSEQALDPESYEDKGTEAWFNVRNMLNPEAETYSNYSFDGKVDRIKADLCTRKYGTTRKGKFMLEPKPLFRKRLKRSPNWGDAMAICYSKLCQRKTFGIYTLPDVTEDSNVYY